MNPLLESARIITRRQFFGKATAGIGAAALASVMNDDLFAAMPGASSPTSAGPTHFPPTAKSVIYLHMSGSPPQQDLFDFKPKLNELNGQPCPDSLFEKERFAFIKGHPKILGTPYKFEQCGDNGAWVSELLPNFKAIVDDVAIVRSLHTDQFNHAPAQMFLYTGDPVQGRVETPFLY